MKRLIFSFIFSAFAFTIFAQNPRFASREERLDAAYSTTLFNTNNAVYFDMLNDPQAIGAKSYLNILDWLQGRVAGLQVYTVNNNERIAYIRNSVAGVYVDEVWRDPSFLDALPIFDIGLIKIIKGPAVAAINSPGGVIAIYTVVDSSL